MFSKSDEEFDEMACDPVRRQKAIVALSVRRQRFMVGSLLISAALGLTLFIWMLKNQGPMIVIVLQGLAALFNWSYLWKTDSDLKILRVIERLHKNSATDKSSPLT